MEKSMAELDAAMLNRDAQVGVLVFAKAGQAPLAGKPLRVLHGNRIMLVFDKDEQSPLALKWVANSRARWPRPPSAKTSRSTARCSLNAWRSS